jgi:hypothetical protein
VVLSGYVCSYACIHGPNRNKRMTQQRLMTQKRLVAHQKVMLRKRVAGRRPEFIVLVITTEETILRQNRLQAKRLQRTSRKIPNPQVATHKRSRLEFKSKSGCCTQEFSQLRFQPLKNRGPCCFSSWPYSVYRNTQRNKLSVQVHSGPMLLDHAGP